MSRSKARQWLCTLLPVVLALTPALLFPLVTFAVGKTSHAQQPLVGPKAYYLALGDSLAFGYQPNLNWAGGYASDFYTNLQARSHDLHQSGLSRRDHYDNDQRRLPISAITQVCLYR